MDEKRKFMRTSSEVLVELSHPGFGVAEMKAKDLSDGGVSVMLGNHIALPVGTVVQACIKRHSGRINEQPVDMEVVHSDRSGMGLMFLN